MQTANRTPLYYVCSNLSQLALHIHIKKLFFKCSLIVYFYIKSWDVLFIFTLFGTTTKYYTTEANQNLWAVFCPCEVIRWNICFANFSDEVWIQTVFLTCCSSIYFPLQSWDGFNPNIFIVEFADKPKDLSSVIGMQLYLYSCWLHNKSTGSCGATLICSIFLFRFFFTKT